VIVSRSDYLFRRLPGRHSADPLENVPSLDLSMRIVRIEGGDRSPHRHPHSREAIYVISGTGRLWEDGVEHRIEAGDCVVIETGVPHATIADPGTTILLVCFFPHADLNANIEELENIVIRATREGLER
jgi:quercetin dioxygenase-like cupin family protein